MDKIILVQEEPRGPSIIIEVPVLADGKGKITLPDVPQLRNTTNQVIIIKAMRLVTPDLLTNAPINGGPAVPIAEAKKISLVLYAEGWEKGQNIPLIDLNDVAGGTFPFRYNKTSFSSWKNVDFNKSYLQYSGSTTSANSPYVVMFEVEYIKVDKDGTEILGPSA